MCYIYAEIILKGTRIKNISLSVSNSHSLMTNNINDTESKILKNEMVPL